MRYQDPQHFVMCNNIAENHQVLQYSAREIATSTVNVEVANPFRFTKMLPCVKLRIVSEHHLPVTVVSRGQTAYF